VKKHDLVSFIYKPTPFERAWLLIKGQPLGIPFTEQENIFINKTLYEAMSSSDELKKREAKELWHHFLSY
jgi:hypothetical protein